MQNHPVVRLATDAMVAAFARYTEEFRRLTRQVRLDFERRDWRAMEGRAEARLLLYGRTIQQVVVEVGRLSLWHAIPPDTLLRRYANLVDERPDADIGRTFYNSAIRRLLGTVGVNPATEFLDLDPPRLDEGGIATALPIPAGTPLAAPIQAAFERLGFRTWADLAGDAARVGRRLARELPELERGARLDLLPEPLIRNRRAFLTGRLATERRQVPLIVPLVPETGGLRPDALLLTADDASIVFGFTRSQFHVDLAAPRQAVAFIRSLIPAKRVDELYTVLGYHKQGKREFFQALERLMTQPEARFEPAPGVPGMVMVVFALPPLNAVFKVIKDRPDPPKSVTRRQVRERYHYVFVTEHGGRLADSQEFEGLSLPAGAFAPEVRDQLVREAARSVTARGDRLLISHLYTERRMTPLDVYLRTADPARARAVVVDFGRAIRDLAGINVFPGDMLAKNFGVTRHGRVVFYDYDEISALTECRFRELPAPRTEEDELAAEPWYPVRDGDVFPEEFERFLRFPEPLHAAFRAEHAELFAPAFWRAVQDRVSRGDLTEPPPYSADRRLAPDGAGSPD